MYIQTSLHLGSGMILIFKNTNNNTLAALFYKILWMVNSTVLHVVNLYVWETVRTITTWQRSALKMITYDI